MFGLAVGIGREIGDATTGFALRHVVFAVVHDAGHVETLHIERGSLSVAIDHVVNRALVVLLEHRNMDDFRFSLLGFGTFRLADENFIGHARHLVSSVAIEDNDIVQIGAVLHKLVLLQTRPHKAFGTIDIQFLIGLSHLGGHNRIEGANLRQARMFGSIFVVDNLKPVGRHLRHVLQVVLYALYFGLDAGYQLLGFLLVEAQDACHLDFEQAQIVLTRDFAVEAGFVGLETLAQMGRNGVEVLRIFKVLVLIHSLLNENLLQTGEVETFEEFVAAYLEFAAQQLFGGIDVVAQDIAHGKELRFVVADDDAVGGDAHLAVRESVERINGFVRRSARREVYENLDLRCRIVVHFSDFYFPLLVGAEDGVDNATRGCAKGNFADNEGFIVELRDGGAHLHRTATQAVLVVAHINATTRQEVGEELEVLAVEVLDSRLANLAKVVGQDLSTQSDGDALCALRQEQGILHR